MNSDEGHPHDWPTVASRSSSKTESSNGSTVQANPFVLSLIGSTHKLPPLNVTPALEAFVEKHENVGYAKVS